MPSFSLPHLKNPKSYFLIFLCALLNIVLISGCGVDREAGLYSESAAEKRFIQICKDEYNWDIVTKFVGNTLWIYIPYEQNIFKFKVNKFSQISKFSVVSLNGDFQKDIFSFEYQIVPLLKSEENKDYTYSLTDQISEDFQYLLNVIYRVYFNAKQQPEFYAIVMADIVNGIEVIYTIYGIDLKKIYNNAIAGEEYYKRILQDIKGNVTIINDKKGRHLIYQEINLDQFLVEQIIQRIRIKFLSSNFELRTTTEEEILKIISYCLNAYEFQDFLMVILKDLSTGLETIKSRVALEEFISGDGSA